MRINKQYDNFREELIVKPQVSMEQSVGQKSESERKMAMDHPLSTDNESVWAQFHKDREIWEEIEKDVKRTRNEIALFIRAFKDEDTLHKHKGLAASATSSVNNWDRLQRQAELK